MEYCAGLNVTHRAGWGARTAKSGEMSNLTLPAFAMIFTQTVSRACDDFQYCRNLVKEIQDFHMDDVNHRFPDIAYNFLLGGDGSVFEGRGWNWRGSFRRGLNSLGFGVALLGTFPSLDNVARNQPYTDLTFAAAKSANALLKCALSAGYLSPNNYTVLESYLDPVIINYIQNPELMHNFPNSVTNFSDFYVKTGNLTFAIESTSHIYRENSDGVIGGATVGVAIVIVLAALAARMIVKRRQMQQGAIDYRTGLVKLVSPHVVEMYELPHWSVTLSELLSHGINGMVYKGTFSEKNARQALGPTLSGRRTVAVKMPRQVSQTASFLTEMSVLMAVGRHTNIVNLEGVVLHRRLMLVMEYCEHGSLWSYLRTPEHTDGFAVSSAGSMVQLFHDNVAYSSNPTDSINNMDVNPDRLELIRFAHQISRAMEFLSSKKVIHRDLAARNILLDGQKTAKVADFGMAKAQPEYILERDKVPLPVCWMAPESIIPGRGVFTPASDVWSFGILLWEMFTGVETPYAAEFPNGIFFEQLCSFLTEGHRLKAAETCPECIAVMMSECWAFDPEDRPNFIQIRDKLAQLLPLENWDRYVVFDAQNDEWNKRLHGCGAGPA